MQGRIGAARCAGSRRALTNSQSQTDLKALCRPQQRQQRHRLTSPLSVAVPRAEFVQSDTAVEDRVGSSFGFTDAEPSASNSLSSIAASFDEQERFASHNGATAAAIPVPDQWNGARGVLAPLSTAWSFYSQKLETNPMVTKGFTSFFGFILGDILAQRIGGNAYDAVRTLRLSMYGLFFDGPVGHVWYKVLDKTVRPHDPTGTPTVLIKTAADQLLWAPVMTCVFFAVLKSLEGHPELILPTIQDKLIKTIVANYVLWPAAHFINFRFVPSEHRILYNNAVSVAWNAYLSTLSNQPSIDTEGLLAVIDQADTLLDSFVPVPIQDQVSAAIAKAFEGFTGLPAGTKRIPINPTRVLDWLHIQL